MSAKTTTLTREYELVYITKVEAGEESLTKIQERIRKVLDEAGGRLLKINVWGRRKLAYEINRNSKGIYYHLVFLSPAAAIKELERNLRLLDDVLRFLVVLIDNDVDPNVKPTEVEISGNPNSGEPAVPPADESAGAGKSGDDDAGDEGDDGDDAGDKN